MKRIYWSCVFGCLAVLATTSRAIANEEMYRPVSIRSGQEINERLSERDIPTGEGGFARDYVVNLQAGDQVAIDLISNDFDTIVQLLTEDGSTIAENDDAPDGTTNSLLFVRINEPGKYTVRVRAFGETGSGNFSLKVTRLQPVRE
ncbi:hypothetical protein NIES970_27210 [[Synechococcus] sp. NIES-970]|uniref:PPC domain-containing protein n=1 Tax=Picosynechococcus sp. NKBG15041c TaxID=1407650 RepID=UPI0004676C37|nr:PPC domain-containing protein [Picosynechococcus sp. NKBG15041c]BAW97765.1 hypothetical protein NIES970_27210 [[Synechococcus] sp. NIES-970]